MALKRSIVLIGSVLVLAACDSVSAPTGPLSLHQGAAASARKADTSTTTRSTSLTGGGCTWVRDGQPAGDSVLVCDDPTIY